MAVARADDAALVLKIRLALGAINHLARVKVLLGRPTPDRKEAERAHALASAKSGGAERARSHISGSDPRLLGGDREADGRARAARRARLLEVGWGAGDRRSREALDMARAARWCGRG